MSYSDDETAELDEVTVRRETAKALLVVIAGEDRGPPKPPRGGTCNGCGVCCVEELCHVAEMATAGCPELDDRAAARALGEPLPGPCPFLRFHDARFWCGLMEAEAALGMEPMIAKALGAGRGCCAMGSDGVVVGMQRRDDLVPLRATRSAQRSDAPGAPSRR